MPATYNKRGLKFLYPENWKLIDEADSDLPCSVSLEAPEGTSFWSLHLYPNSADPDQILKETVSTLQETYPDLEITPWVGDFSDADDSEKFAHESAVEAMFYCLDFLIRTRLQVVRTPDYQLLFWFQAEDREFDKQELIFKALATSVLRG